ncbi:MAG TPA: bifunctional phosphoribosylaminoimidazolecarboxamide formyltransferase/IMP cyclohydrolase PurH, partial [Acidimicrobiales bacterium]
MTTALLSVYDKTGVAELASELHELGWRLISSGGTAKAIADAGLPVTDVAELTGFPAILGHRVVTLHPAVHAGLLADLDQPDHRAELSELGIDPIALLVVNLYPFATRPGIELIDVGGPAMIRAAAKNHAHVGVVVDPAQYRPVLDELREAGTLSTGTRRRLAQQAFARTAAYDSAIARWMAGEIEGGGAEGEASLPAAMTVELERAQDLRYGENPHQRAARYRASGASPPARLTLPATMTVELERVQDLRYGENPHQQAARYRVVGARSWWDEAVQHGGKELSYLNLYDTEAAWRLVHRFGEPAVVIVKHANPCGVAVAGDITDAYVAANACDPVSAFGGIVAANRLVPAALAEALAPVFTEVVVAPSFSGDALSVLGAKKNLRVLSAPPPYSDRLDLRSIDGGLLAQEVDRIS